MDRIYGSGATAAPPTYPATPSNGYPQSANPGLGLSATKPGPWWFHMVTEEIRNVISGAGVTPAGATLTQLQSAISAMIAAQMPAGMVITFSGSAAPVGYVKANGALLNRATYAALWAFAQASVNITASDAAWGATTTPGKYSPGDGSSTFRIPDLRGLFIRPLDDAAGIDVGRVLGSLQSATLIGIQTNNNGTLLIENPDSTATYSAGSATANVTVTATVNKHGVRPTNVALLSCIKY